MSATDAAQDHGGSSGSRTPTRRSSADGDENVTVKTTLFDGRGHAVAYIADDGERSIYLWSGHAVAYITDDVVYGWNGKHLGWFQDGVVYDLQGWQVGFIRERCLCATYAVIFPLKTRPLAGKFPCAVMGSTGGSHDTETAHGGTDHRSPEGCPSGHRGPRALPQARHFGCHFLQVAGEVCGTRSQRCEEAALPRRRKPAVETDGGGASPGHPGAESGHHKKLVGPKAKRTAAQW